MSAGAALPGQRCGSRHSSAVWPWSGSAVCGSVCRNFPSGMKPGLCGLTWALRTMDGRFWTATLRREAKVTTLPSACRCPPSLGLALSHDFSIFTMVESGTARSPKSSLPLGVERGIKTSISKVDFSLNWLSLGCCLNDCHPCSHMTAARGPGPWPAIGKETVPANTDSPTQPLVAHPSQHDLPCPFALGFSPDSLAQLQASVVLPPAPLSPSGCPPPG